MDQGYCYPHRCERDSMGQPYPDCSPGGDGQLLYERGGCVLPGADPCASSRSLCSSGEERKFKDLSAPVRGKEESDMKYPLDGRGGHPGCDSMGGGRYGHLQYDQLHPGWPGSPYPGLHPAIVCKQEEGMSLWAKAQQLQGEAMRQVQSVYGVHFPLEVRHFFATWIEGQPWSDIDLDNPDHEQFASQLRDQLLRLLDEKVADLNSEDMFLVKIKLQETSQQFREMYSTNPMNLVRVVRNCLATEQRLVQQAESVLGDSSQANLHRQITTQFDFLQGRTQKTETDMRQLQQKQESFIIQYQENLKLTHELERLQTQPNGQTRIENEQKLRQQKHVVETQLQGKAQELLRLRIQLADEHLETFKQLEVLRRHILDDQLIAWKRQQQLAGNGAPFEASLETLQQWCETLAELIWTNRQQLMNVQRLYNQLPIDMPPGRQDILQRLQATITTLLSSIVTSTFIIEKQPPQVLKKDSRFTATVRLLVGGKLNVHMNPPNVKATIVSEEQARSLMRDQKDVKNETSGDILNNTGTMDYQQATGQLAVTFRNMALKRIRRAEKKGNETVTEEKFSILFQSRFTVGSGELVFEVWTLSLPVVVTVHGNQECNALATVLWDNAFAEPGRVPFTVPDRVTWRQLSDALNTKFLSSCGLGLTHESLNYLSTKLFVGNEGNPDQMVTWSQFNREPLQGRNFTFWEWFYTIVKLTKDWLSGPWKQRLILGFVSKQEAQDMLLRCSPGTFLLRFSDSEIGGITIAWVAEDPQKPGQMQVWNLAPFTDKDFKIRGLGDRVKDLTNLTLLYPDIPKNVGFEKFWTQVPDASNLKGLLGYVKPDLNTVIPGLMGQAVPLNYDDPQTPQMQPHSPASSYVGNMAADSGLMDTSLEGDSGLNIDLDYNPEDIEHINVNHLLLNCQPPYLSSDMN